MFLARCKKIRPAGGVVSPVRQSPNRHRRSAHRSNTGTHVILWKSQPLLQEHPPFLAFFSLTSSQRNIEQVRNRRLVAPCRASVPASQPPSARRPESRLNLSRPPIIVGRGSFLACSLLSWKWGWEPASSRHGLQPRHPPPVAFPSVAGAPKFFSERKSRPTFFISLRRLQSMPACWSFTILQHEQLLKYKSRVGYPSPP